MIGWSSLLNFSALTNLLHLGPTRSNSLQYNLTAVSAKSGNSIFECWQLTAPLVVTQQTGVVGGVAFSLGNLANASYLWLPADFPGTNHSAPANQYIALLSGTLRLTVEDPPQEIIKHGGGNGILFAADTKDKSPYGHTTGTIDRSAVGLQIPTRDGGIPGHKVLYRGACRESELGLS